MPTQQQIDQLRYQLKRVLPYTEYTRLLIDTLLTALGEESSGGFQTVYKTADETIENDATLTDDADLQFEAEANSIYAVFVYMFITGSQFADYKHAFSVPTGGSAFGNHHMDTLYRGAPFNSHSVGDMTVATDGSISSVANTQFAVISGFVEIGANAGTVAYKWAQNTGFANEFTTLQKGTFMMFKKLN